MRALVYRNTKTALPGWVPIHDKEPRGLAYETDTHFVHMYGKDQFARAISPGLTVTEAKAGNLRDWVERVFGAVEIEEATNDVGCTVSGVWRPGLYQDDEILQGLNVTEVEVRLAEQSLLLLLERLDELLLFIEPNKNGLQTYSHKTRELLILACTEVENCWKQYLCIANVVPPAKGNFTTNHYVRLCDRLFLRELQINFPRYIEVGSVRPFKDWDASNPTHSLQWYDAYNKTKHDRNNYFHQASLRNCIDAVAANLAMFSVRFGPYRLFQGRGTLATIVNPTFTIELCDYAPNSCYAPLVMLPPNQRTDLICYNAWEQLQPRNVRPLIL